MTCSDLQRVLPDVLDGAPTIAFPSEVENHVKTCSDCSDLVSDLKLISSQARNLAESDEPAPRVWVRIAAELRAEGLIRESDAVQPRPHLVPAVPRRRFNAWWLAPVAAAIIAAGSYVVSHKPVPTVAQQQPPAVQVAPDKIKGSEAPRLPSKSVEAPVQVAQVGKTDKSVPMEKPQVESASSADDQQFLSEVSTRAPSMRANYENQLQALNADIRETQEYVDRNPADADARQHLMEAYEQKALLYQMALDRIQ
jgi:Putative zinc-finger